MKKYFLFISVFTLLASGCGQKISSQPAVPNAQQSLNNTNINQVNMNTPDPKMKAAYDAYFSAIVNDNYDAWVKTLAPGVEQSKDGFEGLAQNAKANPTFFAQVQNADFKTAANLDSGIVAYVTDVNFSTDSYQAQVLFLTQVNSEWKVKGYSVFNHGQNDFDTQLQSMLKMASF